MVRSIVVLSVIDAIVEDLKSQVLGQELAPDTPLTEVEVATRYDVARATAKAAIERLVADKVLVRKNHKTARVVSLGPADARDIYLARSYLEREALRQLAERRVVPEAARTANEEIELAWQQGRWTPSMPICASTPRWSTPWAARAQAPRTARWPSKCGCACRNCR